MTTQNHNPDNLTEWGQSEGWRLLTVEERNGQLPEDIQFYDNGVWLPSDSVGRKAKNEWRTYRTREPLPSQPSDDLTYYETELPAVIAGVRRGERFEYYEGGWHCPIVQGEHNLAVHAIELKRRVRLAPVPVVKAWDSAADVPGPVCWMRHENGRMAMVVEFDEDGVVLGGGTDTVSWDGIAGKTGMPPWEHSTDRINWHPCVKPEGGKP